MDGRVEAALGGTGTETLDGVVLLGEALAAIGVESRMPPHRRLVVGDGVGVSDGEGTKTGTVTTITGGYPHLEGIVILLLPGVVDAEAAAAETVVTVEEVGKGRETQDLEVHHAETPDMIERVVDPDGHTRMGGIM